MLTVAHGCYSLCLLFCFINYIGPAPAKELKVLTSSCQPKQHEKLGTDMKPVFQA